MLVSYGGTPTWRLHTGLCKFVQNISANIWSLGKRTDLKFGEMSYLFISYNITISCLYTPNGFRIIFSLCDSATQELWSSATIAMLLIINIYGGFMEGLEVICQKRVRMFHQGFQTPRNRWKHEAAGRVLLLFRAVWNPWWNTKHEFLTWLLNHAQKYNAIGHEKQRIPSGNGK